MFSVYQIRKFIPPEMENCMRTSVILVLACFSVVNLKKKTHTKKDMVGIEKIIPEATET